MSDKSEKTDLPAPLEKQALKAPDAQEARVAGASDLASVERNRTNASDGSLRRHIPEHLAAQEESIELVYGDRVASRKDRRSEIELFRQMADKPENVDTQGLESIAKDSTLPQDTRALAGMIQDMRTQSKALGAPTDALDSYAREALSPELSARALKQSGQGDNLQTYGSQFSAPEKIGITIGANTYGTDQLLAQRPAHIQIVSDATNAKPTDAVTEKTILHGYVSEPDVWNKVAALPEQTQAEVILMAIRAHAEHWGQEQVQRQIGAIIGTTEGIVTIVQDMATITDFSHACLIGDKETASKLAGNFGESFGRMLVGGVNVLKLSDEYLQDLGAQGDWAKPVKDLTYLSQALDQKWAELPPKEQEQLKYRFVVDVGSGLIMPGGAARLFKAGKFAEVFPNMAKIAVEAGTALKELPGDLKKVKQGVGGFFEDMFAPEVATTDGRKVKLTRDIRQHYMMSQADEAGGVRRPNEANPGSLEKPPELRNDALDNFSEIAKFARKFRISMPPKDGYVFYGEKEALSADAAAKRLDITTEQLKTLDKDALFARDLERVPDYRDAYFNKYPGLIPMADQIIVHHSLPQELLTKYPGLFSAAEVNDVEELRGIYKSTNAKLHNSLINKDWFRFIRAHQSTGLTRKKVIDMRNYIDKEHGYKFIPPE